MATLYKGTGTSWLTNWSTTPGVVGATTPTAADDCIVTLNSYATPSFSASDVPMNSLTVDSTAPTTVTVTSSGVNTAIDTNLTIAAGKTFTHQGGTISFQDTGGHIVDVGAGGLYQGNLYRNTGVAGISLTKNGTGRVETSSSSWSGNASYQSFNGAGFTLNAGEYSVGASSTSNVLGTGDVTLNGGTLEFTSQRTVWDGTGASRNLFISGTPTIKSTFGSFQSIPNVASGSGTLSVVCTGAGGSFNLSNASAFTGTFDVAAATRLDLTSTSLHACGLTIASTGSVVFNQSTSGTTGTLTGAGGITTLAGVQLNGSAVNYTGTITGDFTYTGAASTDVTNNGLITGVMTITGSTTSTYRISPGATSIGRNNTGRIGAITLATCIVHGRITGAGTTTVDVGATLRLEGTGAQVVATVNLTAASGTSRFVLGAGAGTGSYTTPPITSTSGALRIQSADTSTVRFGGGATITGATGAVTISTLSTGTLDLTSTISSTRAITKSDTGRLKASDGAAITGAALSINAGSLQLSSTSSVTLGTSLTINSATLVCTQGKAALSSPLTLAAGSSVTFAAADT